MHPSRLARSVVLLAAACLAGGAASAPADGAAKAGVKAKADLASCSKPVYPPAERAAGHTGSSILVFKIGAGGDPVESRIKQSSGHAALDEAARQALMLCKFDPTSVGGKIVGIWSTVEYVWSL
jgi:protein TonB